MEMCSTYKFFVMQIKLIIIWEVLHEDSFRNRGTMSLEAYYVEHNNLLISFFGNLLN